MPSFSVAVVGGATFDISIRKLFEENDLNVDHYDARKSSSLKKQFVSKNTIGVIITVDRSHQAMGDSNELTRNLKNSNIPFVFSSGNFASYNSAKLLIQKISKQYPNVIKPRVNIPENLQKLEVTKNDWKREDLKFINLLELFFEINKLWDSYLSNWKRDLDEWKIIIIDWKEIQTEVIYKDFKKKLNRDLSFFRDWKEELHNFGIKIESGINISIEWKKDIENSINEIIDEHKELEITIKKIDNLNDKNQKAILREWKKSFEDFKDELTVIEKELREFESDIPQIFQNQEEWEKQIKVFYSRLKKAQE
jgi:hypothetical protein